MELVLNAFRFKSHEYQRTIDFYQGVLKMPILRQLDSSSKVRLTFQYPHDAVGLRFEFERASCAPSFDSMPSLPTVPRDNVSVLIYVTNAAMVVSRAEAMGFIVYIPVTNINETVQSAVLLDPNGLRIRLMEVENQPIVPEAYQTAANDASDDGEPRSLPAHASGATASADIDSRGRRAPTARLGYVTVPVSDARRFSQIASFYDGISLPAHARNSTGQPVTATAYAAATVATVGLRPRAAAGSAAPGAGGAGIDLGAGASSDIAAGAGSYLSGFAAPASASAVSAGRNLVVADASGGRAPRHFRRIDQEQSAEALSSFLWLGNESRARRPCLCLLHKSTRAGTGGGSVLAGGGGGGSSSGAASSTSSSSAAAQVALAPHVHPLFAGVSFLVHSLPSAAAQLRLVDGITGARLDVQAAHGLPRHVSFIDPAFVPVEVTDGVTHAPAAATAAASYVAAAIVGSGGGGASSLQYGLDDAALYGSGAADDDAASDRSRPGSTGTGTGTVNAGAGAGEPGACAPSDGTASVGDVSLASLLRFGPGSADAAALGLH